MRSKALYRSYFVLTISLMTCVPAAAEVMTLYAISDAELTGGGGANNNLAAASNWGGLNYLVGNVNQTGGPVSTCPPPAGKVCFQSSSGDDRGLFKFDMSVLPAHAVIDSATVSLYIGFNGFSPITSRITSVSLYHVTSDWTEMGVTYNTRPTWNTTQVTTMSIPAATGTPARPYNGYINGGGSALASLVQGWYDGTTPNYGLLTSDTTNNSGLLRIFSHEAAGTGTDPRLSVTYHVVPVPEPGGMSLVLLWGAGAITFVAARIRRSQRRV